MLQSIDFITSDLKVYLSKKALTMDRIVLLTRKSVFA